MDIFTTNYRESPHQNIKEYMKRALSSSNCELEWIYGSHPRKTLSKVEFLRVLNKLRQDYKNNNTSNTLDIRLQYVKLAKSGLSNIRCSIEGVNNIKRYCRTNSIIDIPNVSFIKKSFYKDEKFPSLEFNTIKNTDYDFRINLKNEIEVDDSNEDVISMKDNLKDGLKYYRYKKRFSFLTSDNLYRIDLTAVKSNTYNPKKKTYNLYKNLVSSNILNGKEIYELEIEYIGYQTINGKIPIEVFYERIKTKDEIDKDDYQSQLCLSEYHPEPSFLPETENYDDDFSGDYYPDSPVPESFEPQDIDWTQDSNDNESNVEYPFEKKEEKTYQISPWTKASSLRGDPLDLINMVYWHNRGGWLFWGITNYNKRILFDGVEINFTDTYENAPNENYVKYIVQPAFTEEEIQELRNRGEKNEFNSFYQKYDESFDNQFNVPFSMIYGLDEQTGSQELKGGGGKPSWAPKSDLGKNQYLVEIVLLKLNEIINQLLKIIHQTNLLISKRKHTMIIDQYKSLTEQNNEYPKFMGPQPVSMSLNELNADNPYSILQGYVVTEKADGIRAELFIDSDKTGYLITQKMEIIHTGLKFTGLEANDMMGRWILDGEYITTNRDGEPIRLFMIFDIYYADNGKYSSHPYTMPWVSKDKSECRSSILHDFKTKINMEPVEITDIKHGILSLNWSNDKDEVDIKDTIRIGFKQYYEGPKTLKKNKKDPSKYTNIGGIGKVSKKILDIDEKKQGYEYSIDGLIYLPMYLSVGSNSEELVKNNINGTWYQNYKWKPPEENTIDFRIRFVKEEIKGKNVHKITSFTKNKKTIRCKQVHLYVGYDIRKDNVSDFTWRVLGKDNTKINEILFNPPSEDEPIHICNLPMNNNKLVCLKDKSEVLDGIIYEMRYVPENPFGYQWIPLRAREDKTRPNDSHTANNVWSTLLSPVTNELIRGKGDIESIQLPSEEEELKEHAYYMDHSEDNETDIILRKFHNYIKDKLINSVTSQGNKSITILDTSIGRGGDISKYLRSKNSISFLLGLDISPDVNKAAKRFYLEHMKKPKAMFIQYDTSLSIKDGNGCVGDNIDRNKLLIDILYDRQKKLPKELRSLVPKYKGLGVKGFDIISSQFTIHYYFKDELSLRGYIQNLSDNLKKGGYFIGTCYDGMKVFQRLSSEKDGHLEMIDEFGNKIYSITQKYDLESFEYQKDNIEKLFGQEIDVYMSSIGQTITEYLVNFELFIDIMKEYDLEPVKLKISKKEFSGIFDNDSMSYQDGFGGFELIINELEKLYSKDLSLKNYYPEAFGLLKEKNKLLSDLSSLNNWFIFQKK